MELVNLLVGIAPAKDTQKTGTNYTSTSTMTSKDPTHEEKSNTTINVPPVVEVNTNREDLSAGEDDAWFNDLIADSSPQELPSMNNSSTKKKISFENGHDGSSNTHVNFSPKPYNREDRHDDPSELNDLNNIDKDSYYAVVDLNKAPQVLVEKAKEHMNVCFEKNRVLSTDANYVYDKQVEFTAPVESNDWDDED